MDILFEGLRYGLMRIFKFDKELFEVIFLTLKVSGIATIISTFLGITIGVVVALMRFPGRNFLISVINTGMGLPPVVVGLFVTIILWRNGPLGGINILYTPYAIIVSQLILATPIIAGFSMASIQNLHPKFHLQVLALGATRLQMFWLIVKEAKLPLFASVMAGFGGIISEVGASMMVGGNIKGYTRVMTTAIVMETSKGNFDIAIAWGIVLLLISYLIVLILTLIQQRGA